MLRQHHFLGILHDDDGEVDTDGELAGLENVSQHISNDVNFGTVLTSIRVLFQHRYYCFGVAQRPQVHHFLYCASSHCQNAEKLIVLVHHPRKLSHLAAIFADLVSKPHDIRHRCVYVLFDVDEGFCYGLAASLYCTLHPVGSQLVDYRLLDTILPFCRNLLISVDDVVVGILIAGWWSIDMGILSLEVDS